MKMTEKEIEKVSELIPFKRYQYFIKRVADSEKIYCLESEEGNWALSELEGKTLFPLWSATSFAANCKVGEWANFKVIELSLTEFNSKLVPLITSEEWLLNVFPVEDRTGFVVAFEEFTRDLEDELSNYE